jgi:2'-5' RNA ligase
MRAFIAVDLPEAIKTAISDQQHALRRTLSTLQERNDDIKWTRPEGVHATLKFLGEISERQVTQVSDALAGLEDFEPFALQVKGFGFFPDARRPRVLWVGVEAPQPGGVAPVGTGHGQELVLTPQPPESNGNAAAALAQLAGRVERACESLGFALEGRAFSPHLTLARFKVPKPQPELVTLLEAKRELTLGQFEVSEFFLFESRLSPHGAQYRKVARFPR